MTSLKFEKKFHALSPLRHPKYLFYLDLHTKCHKIINFPLLDGWRDQFMYPYAIYCNKEGYLIAHLIH